MAAADDTTKNDSTATNDSSTDQSFSCLYFGFASNLSPRAIKSRCPSALYAGLGVLKGWKFVISPMGFGNIVPGEPEDEVYGTLNFLIKRDEDALDKSEEVPWWHQKRTFKVRRVPGDQEVEVMTYVDVERTGEGIISKEYIPFMRKAVADGLRIGVPQAYVDRYLSKWLPERYAGEEGKVEQITMVRTLQVDKEDLGYMPSHMLKTK